MPRLLSEMLTKPSPQQASDVSIAPVTLIRTQTHTLSFPTHVPASKPFLSVQGRQGMKGVQSEAKGLPRPGLGDRGPEKPPLLLLSLLLPSPSSQFSIASLDR